LRTLNRTLNRALGGRRGEATSVTLPVLTYQRTDTIQGDPGTQLEEYLSERSPCRPRPCGSRSAAPSACRRISSRGP